MASDGNQHQGEASLVPMLLVMTGVTGAIDAVSILRLGHVFVANMTGNVVFLGFALARASGFSVSASLVALGAFLVGAAIGGRLPPLAPRRALTRMATSEAVLVIVAAALAAAATGTVARYVMTTLLALAMGGQNAIARKLAVPDLTTTVLTLTLTGLAADRPDLSKPNSHSARRFAAVTAMLAGAVLGALLVLNTSPAWALGGAAAPLLAVAGAVRYAK